jgi:hypothetical protein
MKTQVRISIVLVCGLFLSALIGNPVLARTAVKGDGDGKPIPENIMKIAEKSCVKCHTEPGDFMAISHLNLSNWTKYSAKKQASKTKAMCRMVSEDKMPPKKFRENHPQDVPTKEEISAICSWAASLEPPKK